MIKKLIKKITVDFLIYNISIFKMYILRYKGLIILYIREKIVKFGKEVNYE